MLRLRGNLLNASVMWPGPAVCFLRRSVRPCRYLQMIQSGSLFQVWVWSPRTAGASWWSTGDWTSGLWNNNTMQILRISLQTSLMWAAGSSDSLYLSAGWSSWSDSPPSIRSRRLPSLRGQRSQRLLSPPHRSAPWWDLSLLSDGPGYCPGVSTHTHTQYL